MHTRLFPLILCLLPLCTSAQSFIESYDKGNWETCIKQCEKSIDKKEDTKTAYLYKARSYEKMYLIDTSCLACLTKSLSSLEMLSYKDPDSSLRKKYAIDIDGIYGTILSVVGQSMEQGQTWTIKDWTKRMLKLTPDYRVPYAMGKFEELDGNQVEATSWYNKSARKLYLDWQHGQAPPTASLEVFTALGRGLLDSWDYTSTITVWNRALKMYDAEKAALAYSTFVMEHMLGKNTYLSESMRQQIFDATDTISSVYKHQALDTIRYRLLQESINEMTAESNAFLQETVCQRYPAIQHPILKKMYANWSAEVNFYMMQGELVASFDTLLTKGILETVQCLHLSPDQTWHPERIFLTSIETDPLQAAKIYYCFSGAGYSSSSWESAAKKLSELLRIQLEQNGYSREIYLAQLALPTNKVAGKVVLTAAMQAIRKEIEAGHFSAAGDWLRNELFRYPGNAELMDTYRYWVEEDYRRSFLGNFPDYDAYGWTGNTGTCDAGTINPDLYPAFLEILNYTRRLAGVPDSCVLSEEWNALCQETALMMHAANDLDHHPSDNWPCYSKDGARAAGNANLSLGYGGVPALIGQIQDEGGGNTSVGHRRWILNPYRRVFGFGTTPNAMALWTLGGQDANYDRSLTQGFNERYVAWPPAHYVPTRFMVRRWSFSMTFADFSQATVEVYQGKSKQVVRVLEPDNGYGQNTLVWEIDNLPLYDQVEVAYTVHVKGVKTGDEIKDFTYQVIFIPL